MTENMVNVIATFGEHDYDLEWTEMQLWHLAGYQHPDQEWDSTDEEVVTSDEYDTL